eukprot:g4379.t1
MGAVPGIVGGTAGALTASAGASASNMIQWSVAKSPHKLPRPATGGPVQVKVNMDVHQMYEIKPQDTSMVLELRLEVEWNNPHLIGVVGPTTVTAPGPNGTTTSVSAVATRVLPENEVKFMWLPSITFSNEIDLPIEVASRATLSSNGNVNYLRRFKLTAAEDFSGLVDYLESYANSAEDVQLMAWDGTNVESRENKMLVKSIPPEAKKNQGVFDILGSVLELEIRRTLNSDKATIIICKLFVVRRFIMAIFEIVIPLFLTVSFTMVGLFYRLSVVDVRTNLCMIGFLTTVMYLFIIKQDLPPISYLTWTHYYMIVCLCFIGSKMVSMKVKMKMIQQLGLVQSSLPVIDLWCRRILPLLFTVTVFIMVMAETQNMQWKGPPEYVQIIENEVAAVTSGSNGNGQAFTPQLQ